MAMIKEKYWIDTEKHEWKVSEIKNDETWLYL